jgi:hypothetical protein
MMDNDGPDLHPELGRWAETTQRAARLLKESLGAIEIARRSMEESKRIRERINRRNSNSSRDSELPE